MLEVLLNIVLVIVCVAGPSIIMYAIMKDQTRKSK